MAMKYLQATDQEDFRMPATPLHLVQPWKAWWPPKPNEHGTVTECDRDPANGPWHLWTFDNSQRFEKPWLEWSLRLPPTYS